MTHDQPIPDGPLWVFGYGSLLWHPGFPFDEQVLATLTGWHRSFCMRSIHHRGTVDHPGLVLALDRAEGGKCRGIAFRVPDQAKADTVAYLRERELISSAYLENWLPLDLADGRKITSLAYVIDPSHDQYCGTLDLESQAQIIASAVGGRGPNTEYLWNTTQHLTGLGIPDPDLEWLDARVREITGKPA